MYCVTVVLNVLLDADGEDDPRIRDVIALGVGARRECLMYRDCAAEVEWSITEVVSTPWEPIT
jgi:hypothetical protein